MARPSKAKEEIYVSRKYRLPPELIERFEKNVPAGRRSKIVTFAMRNYLDSYYPENNLAIPQKLSSSEPHQDK